MNDKIIGISELKTYFSRILRGVEKGQKVTITKQGKPVAILAPVEKKGRAF